tara:strand:- start:46 stop:654 length:609 start_codon:yes stop_codon:yes gene_type:complete
MKTIVVSIKNSSDILLVESSTQLFLENNNKVDLIDRKGSYEIAESVCNINIPVEPMAQENFCRDKLNVQTGELTCYRCKHNSASIDSVSYKIKVILIVTCSIEILRRIASSFLLNLIERCADFHLNENRPLIISTRESPLNLIHIENINRLAKADALIVPSIPSSFTNPKTIEDIIDFIAVRLFNSLGEHIYKIKRWFSSKK